MVPKLKLDPSRKQKKEPVEHTNPLVKKKPQPIARPTGALTRENVQIKSNDRYSVDATLTGKKQSAEVAEEEEQLVLVDAREEFTEQAFREVWKQLAEKIK